MAVRCGWSTAQSSVFAGGGGVIDREGGKGRALEALYEWTIERIHVGAYDPKARIEVMDDSGIWAQVCFPNSIGLGGQGISDVVNDPEDPHCDEHRRKANPPPSCSQQSVTIPAEAGAKLRQSLLFASLEWQRTYATLRNTNVGFNCYVKDPVHEAGLGRPRAPTPLLGRSRGATCGP